MDYDRKEDSFIFLIFELARIGCLRVQDLQGMSQQLERMFNPGSSGAERPGVFQCEKSLKTTYPILPWKTRGLAGEFKTYQSCDIV